MKVGDLIRDKRWEDISSLGVIVHIGDLRTKEPYHILCQGGKVLQFEKKYVREGCEVVNESR